MILTDAGAIAMHFDLTDDLSAADVMRAESRITKRLVFLKALASVKSRCVVVDSAAAKVDANCSYDEFEKRVLPQLDGERLITRYTGKIHADSCNKTCMRGCCTTRRTWHPACCLFWTCGINPFVAKTSVLVSDATVYALKSDENEPYCSPGGFCHTWVKRSDWSIYWTPLTDLTGVEVSSMLTGTETFWSRCCYGKWCGNNCCPMLRSEVTLSLLCNGVTMQAKDISQFASIRDKSEIVAFRKRMSQVQALMMEQNINSMSSVMEFLGNVVPPGAIPADTADLRTSTSSEQTEQNINSISSVMEFLEIVPPGAIPADTAEQAQWAARPDSPRGHFHMCVCVCVCVCVTPVFLNTATVTMCLCVVGRPTVAPSSDCLCKSMCSYVLK
jgi:hypothetical protein